MRVLCCGSRDFSNIQMVVDRLSSLDKTTIIIEGEAPGADTICKEVGKVLGFVIEKYPVDWNRYGKKAGIVRNSEMLEKNIDLVLAFKSKQESPGTNDTIFKAIIKHIPYEIFEDY